VGEEPREINFLELFSGIGGFSLGLQQAGLKIGWHGFSDIDKYSNEVFRRRFPDAEELGSVTDINPDRLPRVDLITFGFPCQDLSQAGRRAGLQGERSGLFFEAMRIIRAKKPKYFIFENVKGVFSSNKGEDFTIILQEIAESGYDGQWQLLNTKWFLPQNRERVYFVGHLRGTSRPKVFPIGETPPESRKSREGKNGVQISSSSPREYGWKDFSPALLSRDYKDPKLVKIGKVCDGDAGRIFDSNGIACCLKALGGGLGAKTGLYRVEYNNKQLNETLEQNDLKENDVKALDLYNRKAQDVSPTLTDPKHTSLRLFEKSKIRKLTPVECSRLQGFPDHWNEGLSDTQRYKQMGNAVSVPVVELIMRKLYYS
tara:strand:- start:89 stop:1204 length:1116 start_codon:yes stop_codon:yes gene_type:complete